MLNLPIIVKTWQLQPVNILLDYTECTQTQLPWCPDTYSFIFLKLRQGYKLCEYSNNASIVNNFVTHSDEYNIWVNLIVGHVNMG